MIIRLSAFAGVLLAVAPLHAQMEMAQPSTLIQNELQHSTSGTSIEPASTPMSMLMRQASGWRLMLHGTAFIAETQQHAANKRGADKLFSTNWIMPMAQHKLGSRGTLTMRTMLSLEPATITGHHYPELFQQGETAYGKPIVDGQHPHDFFMELAALYDYRASEHVLLSFYAAPVGDPAIGPTAYPHRQSASEDPIAALGHHQEDSTHIAFNVVTAGLTYKALRLESSGFHGAEPDEQRWKLQPSPNGLAVDSYSARLTYAPTSNLAAQYSIAEITAPEALQPTINQRRQTASLLYSRSFGARHAMAGMAMVGDHEATGNWSTTALWGQTRASTTGLTENSYLVESLVKFSSRNFVWTRIEVASRTSELLHESISALETSVGHVQGYSLGFDREFRLGKHLLAAPGGQVSLYRSPGLLTQAYGSTPYAGQAFLRLRLAE